jgi:integrase/recombinase XerD
MDAEIRDYLDHLVLDRERAPNTTDRYAALLGRFAAFVRRDLGRSAIVPADVDRRLAELFVRHGGNETGAHHAPSTRNVRLAALRGWLRYMVAMGRLDRDPTVGLLSAKVKANSPGYVTEHEFEHFCAVVINRATESYAARDEALFKAMMNCGLRISEALSLDLAQIDLDALCFHGVMRKGRIREDVVMNRTAADAIRRWLLYRPNYKNAAASDALFLSDRGGRWSARAVQRSFRRYVDLAGFGHKRLTPHSLRHSCATALIRRGVGIETVADVLAHRRLDTTRIYLHLGSQRKLEAISLLGTGENPPKPRNRRLTRPITPGTIASGSAGKDASATRVAGTGSSLGGGP